MKPTLLGLPTSTMDGDGNMGAIVNGGTAYTNLINGQGDAIATANSSTKERDS
jgi:hypothetical protein